MQWHGMQSKCTSAVIHVPIRRAISPALLLYYGRTPFRAFCSHMMPLSALMFRSARGQYVSSTATIVL
jgi:hypothetical protein